MAERAQLQAQLKEIESKLLVLDQKEEKTRAEQGQILAAETPKTSETPP
jgi:hypothetical protein